MLAKRKRKKKSIGAQLKYEVYGILLITVSVIALSGEAAVGRSLSKLAGLLLGKFYFVLPLIGIYVGLAVMVKRTWPSGWSSRKTGIVLTVLALTLMSAISEIDRKLAPAGLLSSGAILHQLGNDIRGALLTTAVPGDSSMLNKDISGGYAGAIQYALLYALFGYFGAKFIMIVMFAISFMLMTGKSYVELARILKQRGGRMIKLLRLKMNAGTAASQPIQAVSKRKAGKTPEVPLMVLDDDEVMDDDDAFEPLPERKRKTLFFNMFQGQKKPSESAADHAARENGEPLEFDDDQDEVPLFGQQKKDWQREEDEAVLADTPSFPPIEDGVDGTESVQTEVLPWEETGAPQTQEEPPAAHWPDSLAPPVHLGEDNGSLLADGEDTAVEGTEIRSDVSANPVQAAHSGQASPASAESDAPAQLSRPYLLPPLGLLAKPQHGKSGPADTSDSKRKLEMTLESFGVKAKVLDVVRGPAVTRYEVQPATGVKVSRIVSLTDDIALALAAKDIRMEAPIPGKSAIGIEVPNTEVSMVTMREVMETAAFQQAPAKLSIAFGRDISGQPIVGNLARMPHLLVAGATGSGKSVCINGIITSILYKAAPDEVKFLMIDPKMVELNVYNGIPHLLAPVVTDPRRASLALKKIVVEMEKRYELFSKSSTRNIEGYNTLMKDNPSAVLPYIVVIVDELADLMMVAAGDVEDAITRLAQMARAAGIHLIIATQRPSVDVITGVIKANIPSRIAFGVSSQVDSRTILDMVGAEKLLGRGDMLFLPVGMSKPIRVQGAFLSDQEVEAVVNFSREQAEAEYKEDLVPEIEESAQGEQDDLDELFDQAVQIVVEAKQASVSLLQRRMRVGYTRAARLIDQMEAKGIVGPYEGSKPREVLMSIEQMQASRITS
ncbi:DNA translocase FtsK [Paenibacillus tarimensis]|uniref:DNA translocase FtsK n=1 Tax=Paenibacillus tarimensis TaxID=416012 RepID=UPI001F163FB9|nr:DNA translocase FtsK [Paenibacillus tarimensis]MCF2942368.1 DNA translocase FtsK [Paenibacillus tarimensis]